MWPSCLYINICWEMCFNCPLYVYAVSHSRARTAGQKTRTWKRSPYKQVCWCIYHQVGCFNEYMLVIWHSFTDMRLICCAALETTQAELHELKTKYDEESTAKWVTHFHSDGTQQETARIPLLYFLDCLLGTLRLCLTFAHTFTHMCVSIQTQTNTYTPLWSSPKQLIILLQTGLIMGKTQCGEITPSFTDKLIFNSPHVPPMLPLWLHKI